MPRARNSDQKRVKIGRWEIGHGHVSRRFLETGHGLKKTERKWRLGQDQQTAMLDMRNTNVESRALDGEGYVH